MVKVHEGGWWVAEIKHGRWDIKETCEQIIKAVMKYEPVAVGIEKGSLKNAALPYLMDLTIWQTAYATLHRNYIHCVQ